MRENTNFMEKFLFETIKFKTIVFSEVSTGFFIACIWKKKLSLYIHIKNKEIFFFRDYENNGFTKKKINENYLNSYPFR